MLKKGAHVLKTLVGRDLLDVERKCVNDRNQGLGNFNVWITCNSQLKVKLEGDSGAWERRLMIIDNNKPKPTKPDPDSPIGCFGKKIQVFCRGWLRVLSN